MKAGVLKMNTLVSIYKMVNNKWNKIIFTCSSPRKQTLRSSDEIERNRALKNCAHNSLFF